MSPPESGSGGAPGGSAPATSIVDHLIDGVTVASIVTLVAYAIVFGFEEGFNTFFQLPADYVGTSFLSVFHVLTLVAFTIAQDASAAVSECLALVVLLFVPAHVFARRAWLLALLTLVLYSISTVFQPAVLLGIAVVVCLALYRRTREKAGARTRFISRVGDNAAKATFVFLLLLTPLFYFGFHYAEIQNPRLVITDGGKTWIVARILNGEFLTVGASHLGSPVPGCVNQFPDRPEAISRVLHIVKDDQTSPLEWQEFTSPLNYCLFASEKAMLIAPMLATFVLVRQGPATPAPATPPPATPRAPATAAAPR